MVSSAEVNSRPESVKTKVPSVETDRPERQNFLRGALAKLQGERGCSAPRVEPSKPADDKEDYASQIEWPHGKVILEVFRRAFPQYPRKQAELKRINKTFFNQEMLRTETSTDVEGISVPRTSISVNELASKLTGLPIPQINEGEPPKIKKVFVFPSFPFLANGHQFTFVEMAYKEAMRALPRAIDDLRKGKITQDVEIYTFGSPTNKKWGQVTEEYVAKLQKDAYGTLEETYAKMMADTIPQDPNLRAKTSIVAIGHSMAANLAAGSAEMLIEKGLATQDGKVRSEQGVPFVQVIMDASVTLNKSRLRGPEIMIGFGIDSIVSSANSPHIRNAALGEGKFLQALEQPLAQRGISTHEDKESIELKKKGQDAIAGIHGVVPTGEMYRANLKVNTDKIHVNIRRGMLDLTIPPIGFDIRAVWHKAVLWNRGRQHAGEYATIGKDLVPHTHLDVSDNTSVKAREFAVYGRHIFPVTFRPKEAAVWNKTVIRLSGVEYPSAPKQK